MLLISLVALFFLFNTGQLSQEKTKLVNTADAVAYSAGVLHARVLNFDAYSNRAMIANEVSIAQLVSVGSWAKYVEAEGNSYNNCLPCSFLLDIFGLDTFADYAYEVAGDMADQMSADNGVQAVAKNGAMANDKVVQTILTVSQDILYQGVVLARKTMMQEVADANYQGSGPVTVDLVPIQSDLGTTLDVALSSNGPFMKKYENDERTRFADVVKEAVYRDSFVKQRNWGTVATSSLCWGTFQGSMYDWMTKVGGTEMIGFDEWKAMDTLSWWHWTQGATKYSGPICTLGEIPVGYGATVIDKDSDEDNFSNLEYYSYSRVVNPLSSLIADSDTEEWKFSGLPSFYDLTDKMLQKDDPRLQFAIRLTRNQTDTRTSDAQSIVKPTGSLDQYHGKAAHDVAKGKGVLAALSASEVYFQRPPYESLNQDANKAEIGSLFNPFWQVHLISPSSTNVNATYGLQGTVAPQ
jgi:hypothetical protein